MDNAKAILIFLVVLGHTIERNTNLFPLDSLYLVIYSFHMAAFVFVSGYFASDKLDIVRVFKGSVIPYIIFQICFKLFTSFISGQSFSLTLLTPAWGLWYILAVGIWSIILPFFSRMKYGIWIAFALGLLSGCVDDINSAFNISRVFFFFPFYLSAFHIKKGNIVVPKYLYKKRWRLMTAACALCVIIIGLCCFKIYGVPFSLASEFLYGRNAYSHIGVSIGTGILFRTAVYFIAVMVGSAFFMIVPRKKTAVSYMGGNSFSAYILHFYVITLISSLTNLYKGLPDVWEYLFMIASSMVIVWLLTLNPVERTLAKVRNLY